MLTLVVLAAGKGTRMKSDLPKVLHPVLGAPLLEYSFEKAAALGVDHVVAVIGHGRERIQEAFAGRRVLWAIQEEQKGTGHAAHVGVERAYAHWKEAGEPVDGAPDDGDFLVVNGDLPLLRPETLRGLLDAHASSGAEVTLLTRVKQDPTGFGRIVRAPGASSGEPGAFQSIVEEPDADAATRAIREVNVGTYVFKGRAFRELFERTGTDNRQGEYYLTDVAVEAARDGRVVATFEVEDEAETAQVNSQAELAEVTRLMRERRMVELLESGVRIDDPVSTYIETGVEIEPGARIAPFCVIRRGVRIAAGCEVGPFAHLRPGTVLETGASVGNFVEIKASTLGEGAKARHLSYVGDGEIGAGVNIGAGTIFANYDGSRKHRTVVGDGAFIGSGTILVAPVSVGAGAKTGAGSVVLRGRDVAAGDTVAGVPARPLRGSAGKDSQSGVGTHG